MESGSKPPDNHVQALSKREQERRNLIFPPKPRIHEWLFLIGSLTFIALSAFYICSQFLQFASFGIFKPSVLCTYAALAAILGFVITWNVTYHRFRVHKARLEDRSVVDSLFAEADNFDHLPNDPGKFEAKKKQLNEEISRLKKIGNRGWTEFQILTLTQMLLEYLDDDELIAQAHSSLSELLDYAEDSAYRFDWKQYYQWETRIDNGIRKVEEASDSEEHDREKAVDVLRARLEMLLDFIADYQMKWSEGSTIIYGIIISSVFTIPITLVMGILPILHPAMVNPEIGVLNWGLLGITGAISAVLIGLRKSNYVEVGNTEGKKELRRTISGSCLGLVAGVILYSMIRGGILSGSLFPQFHSSPTELFNIFRSIFWAVGAGFSFEKIFNHLRGASDSET